MGIIDIIGWFLWGIAVLLMLSFSLKARSFIAMGESMAKTDFGVALTEGFLFFIAIIIFYFTTLNKLHLIWVILIIYFGSVSLVLPGIPFVSPLLARISLTIFAPLILMGISSKPTNDIQSWVNFLTFNETKEKAEKGDAEAQYILGSMYVVGETVKQDFAKAKTWFKKAGNQGYAKAQFALWSLYDYGWGVKQNFAKAKAWFEKAANQGHAEEQYNLGVMYKEGQGVKQDIAKAKSWFTKAAYQGHAKARNNLIVMGTEGTKELPK
jgi:hypothetical protein